MSEKVTVEYYSAFFLFNNTKCTKTEQGYRTCNILQTAPDILSVQQQIPGPLAMRAHSYLSKPVRVRDGDVVHPEASVTVPAVCNAGEGRKVAVQVDVLCVSTSAGPSVKDVALNILHSCSQRKGRGRGILFQEKGR